MGDARALNLWLSLSRCGDEAPGLDLVPRRLDEIVDRARRDALRRPDPRAAPPRRRGRRRRDPAADLRAGRRAVLRRDVPAPDRRRTRRCRTRASRSRAGSSAPTGSRRTTRRSPCERRHRRAASSIEARGIQQDVPHPRAPHRLAQGARHPPVRARRRTASTTRCATSASTSTRASSSASSGATARARAAAEDPRRASTAPTAGASRMAGRVAPFIELGVGFNHELTARENVVLNGVLMGLTLREARSRLDAVLDVRRARGLRRPAAQELLVGDDRPPRVRDDGPGRRRHHAHRRGARGRRRRVRAEVHGRLPREAPRRARRSCSSRTT